MNMTDAPDVYRGLIKESVTPLTEQASDTLLEGRNEIFSPLLAYEKADCLGYGKVACSLVIIETTFDIVGLSAAFS